MLLSNTFLNTKNRIMEEINRNKCHPHTHPDEKPSKKKPDILIETGDSTSALVPKTSPH